MIDPKAITTYAQYNEDLILLALLRDVKNGFYIDVGANYPTIDSVTKLFYDRGWRGINVEPLEKLHAQLAKERPEDVNIMCGLGDKAGRAVFREFTEAHGHSTFDSQQMRQHGNQIAHVDREIEIKTLESILAEHKVERIHFLKVDVEGYEYQVIAGNDWKKFRPEVICIEANHMSHDWRPLLEKHDYKLFIRDGLNEYYVAAESWTRTEGFAERMISLDYHALKQHQQQSWSEDSRDLVRLHELVKVLSDQNEAYRTQIAELAELSLKDKNLLQRLHSTSKGLTTDWVKYRRAKRSPGS